MTTGRPRYRAVDFLPMPEHTNAAASARRPWFVYVVSDLLVYAAFVVVVVLLAFLIVLAIRPMTADHEPFSMPLVRARPIGSDFHRLAFALECPPVDLYKITYDDVAQSDDN